MKAVILAGGLGVRLRPLTFSIPKPLIPVEEKPILEIILTHLKSYGIKEFIFSVGYHADLIKAYFQDGESFGVNIKYVSDDKPLGTAGPLQMIHQVYPFEKGETFLLMNGDILTKLNIERIVAFHKTNNSPLTTAIKIIKEQSAFGEVEIQGGHVVNIQEKPLNEYRINAGVYIVSEEVLGCIPPNIFFTMPEVIHALIQNGDTIGAYLMDEYWLGIDSHELMQKARDEITLWNS